MKAAGVSAVMDARRKYSLPAAFTEDQLNAAASKCDSQPYGYSYEHSVQQPAGCYYGYDAH